MTMSRSALLGTISIGAAAMAALVAFGDSSPASAEGVKVPAPSVVDKPAGHREVAILAGGCFWGVEGVYEHVRGVADVVSGFAGGGKSNANYENVSSGKTGKAEAVRIVFDPTRVSYAEILRIYFSVVTDPTQLNRQGPDTGTQYRSAIFAQNGDQQHIAQAYIAQLSQAAVFSAPIVTTIEPSTGFFPAEGYHQNYLDSHPTSAYIVMNDMPKVADLERLFPQRYRDQPVLVSVNG
jgi:peptide-methionine (S)-S-oxide reductase